MLRERIATGIYRPGAPIREASLRMEFHVSNGPVRQAFQPLIAEGLLITAHGHGVKVCELSQRQVDDLFEIRAGLLSIGAELAAVRAPSSFQEGGNKLIARMCAANAAKDVSGQMPIGKDFMTYVFEGSGNIRLASMWAKEMQPLRYYIHRSLDIGGDVDGVVEICERLIVAIASRDRARARATAIELVERQRIDLSLDGCL